MSRLIDADALKKLWCENCDNKHFCNEEIYCDSVKQLYEQPTVDAVEVVRCKDCIHFWDGVCKAHIDVIDVDKDDYCSRGEEKR